MNRSRGRAPAILCSFGLAAAAWAGDPFERFTDPAGDALLRRTDPGADGPLNPSQILPDLLTCTLSKWQSPTAAANPFYGSTIDVPDAHLFRIDLVFNGLINPPGPLEISGQHDPFRYGPSPLYGFLELNIDRDRLTGGDPTPEATNRFLANVGRFGALPDESIADRVVIHAGQILGHSWLDQPQFELSGAEFTLKLCGCEPLNLLSTSIPGDTAFSSGDAWVLSGRVFERSRGFDPISRMNTTGGACGRPGEYAPIVRLRFCHNPTANTTTVSLVYALDQLGAAQLAGLGATPPANLLVECDGNSGSIYEAMKDIADAATQCQQGAGWPDLFTRTLAQRWAFQANSLADMLDPTDWRATALFGTTYSTTISQPSSESALYAWTDAGFELDRGDLDGNGVKNRFDRGFITTHITSTDGTSDDADGVVNGAVAVLNHGPEFDIGDLDGDGVIDSRDESISAVLLTCSGDWNGDRAVTVQDVFDFIGDWFAVNADANFDGFTTTQDIFDYLADYFQGCP
ncbi:MAG: hypothetical protein IT438_16595 [Phycisphaerales bacterium]|nr:hypothetical protein [Phycisphaerales bacterium]